MERERGKKKRVKGGGVWVGVYLLQCQLIAHLLANGCKESRRK